MLFILPGPTTIGPRPLKFEFSCVVEDSVTLISFASKLSPILLAAKFPVNAEVAKAIEATKSTSTTS
ncbi:hypothetical protein CFSAN002369_00500 [Clostridium botulinum CFSAN002369]|nr:hypothetical protein CFSAN002369_00500 [Clostridium botulinum CFSAN002369]